MAAAGEDGKGATSGEHWMSGTGAGGGRHLAQYLLATPEDDAQFQARRQNVTACD